MRGDMVKIQQILYNLIDNAVKFSNNDSSIKIETSIRNEKVFISVKDHGIGIPKDSLSKSGSASIRVIYPEERINAVRDLVCL